MKCSINSLYLCVDNMDRAINFYEQLFNQKVTKRDRIYSIFNIDGFRLGLFAYKEVNEEHTFGSNCLPSIEVESLDDIKKVLGNTQLVFPITQIGNNWVAEFSDSEGNHIEITTPVQ